MLLPLRFALSFLTRLPVSLGLDDKDGARALPSSAFGRAAVCFPLVGCLVGGLGVALATAVVRYLGAPITSVLLIALAALITGGLHLDGLADLFDGLGGYRGERARMLEIMRDPRIGAHGCTALILSLALKILLTSELLARAQLLPLMAAAVCARFCAVPLLAWFAYARPQGLGAEFQKHTSSRHVLGAALITLAALYALGNVTLLLPALCALLTALAVAAWVSPKLGGLTGDVYGAAIELSELAFLLCCLVSLHARA